jgi:hypothetical protein
MKLQFTVFYSWQTDLDSKYNRNFILDALEKAVKSIGRDDNITVEAVLDRDTMGLPGSPSIVESITAKIAKSDLFIGDVSIINSKRKDRPTPNPNVLFELGYASAVLGWERIILIQNTSYGGPEKLPFDLRGRRILPYSVDEETKTAKKQKLKEELITTFKYILSYASTGMSLKEHIIWWGTWKMQTKSNAHGGTLRINRVSSDAFFFNILIFDGARTGIIHGRANILTPHSAYARIQTTDNKQCEISFQRHLHADNWQIVVVEGQQCSYFHGIGASFSSTYLHSPESAVDRGFLDEIDLNELERICGKYLPRLLTNFSIVQQETLHDSEIYKIYTSFVKGLYPTTHTIIALTETGKLWCAGIDLKDEVVRYFYNTPETVRPKFIEDWLESCAGMKIVVNDPGEPGPLY